jgi:hypothetical protein
MKVIKFLTFVVWCISLATIAGASTVHHKVVFDHDLTIDSVKADDGNVYTRVSLAGCYLSQTEGAPKLPVKTLKLIIPANQEPDKVVIKKGAVSMLSVSYPVLPVQKPVPTQIGFEGNEFVSPDKAIYQSEKTYPAERAQLIRTNGIRGNKVVLIDVYPVAYNPAKGQLEYAQNIDVELHLKASKKVLRTSMVKNKKKYDKYLEALVDNKTDVEKYSVIEQRDDPVSETGMKSISVYCEYVVITTSTLAPYFDDFITWKKQKGIDIELVTVESIYQNYTGDLISGIYDNAGKIRQFLSDAYGNGLEYALLGGTSSVVPIRYGWGTTGSTYSHYKIPTDLYFSDFDGDSRYGEPYHDDVKYGAEISVGRLLCTSGSQVQNWSNKLLLYEQNPGNGNTTYLKKALYTQADDMQEDDQATDIASRFGSIFTTDEIIEEEYDDVPDYNSPESPQFPTGAEVISEMNSGYGFISWFNHGSPDNVAVAAKRKNECGSNDKKKITNYDSNTSSYCLFPESGNGLDNLSNSTKPFVLYSLACETTPFDIWKGISPTSNLGAQITNQSGKGGPIFLGNTRKGFVSSSWYIQQEFTNILASGTYRLGMAEALSKASNIDHYACLSHNLIGCPETEMWTDTPSEFTTAYAAICGNDVVVNTGGVTNTNVCVMSANDAGASYWQFNNSSTTEKTFYNVPEPFVVTITKHNYLPKIIESADIETAISSSISGPSNLCSSDVSFELEEIPAGATISWNQSSNLARVSSQGANPCLFQVTGSGSVWVEATVTSICGTSVLPRKTVSPGVTATISGPSSILAGSSGTYTANVTCGASPLTYQWWLREIDSGIAATVIGNSNPLTLLSVPRSSKSVLESKDRTSRQPEDRTYYELYLKVTDANSNNYTTEEMQITAYGDVDLCSFIRNSTAMISEDNIGSVSLLAYPNPTTSETTLTLVIPKETKVDGLSSWELEIYSEDRVLRERKLDIHSKECKVNTTGWDAGIYVVMAKYKNEIVTGKLFVK